MSYVVLARKYRPRRFDQMVGQAHVVRALTNALEQQRLHHAYLFTGTRGIGKTTVSRILAKSLNCVGEDGLGGVTAKPCGVCPACTAIDQDRFVDYIELDAASNRSIEEVRDLIERAAYKPASGRFKVFMIDEAHQLTKDAFNALLKTLEEPPEYLKFVLATTDPEKMLPTVLSRCLQFNLRPMAPEVVRQHLELVLAQEGVACDEASLRLLGRAARGSMRDALSLTDQAIAYGGGRVDEATVRAMLGKTGQAHASTLLAAIAGRDAAGLLEGLDQVRQQGGSAQSLVEEMAELLQLAAVEQACPGSLDDGDERSPAARTLASAMAADEMQLVFSMLLRGRDELALLGDELAALTMLLLRPLAFAPVAGADARPEAAGGRREQPLRAPRASSASAPVTPPAAGPEPAAGAPARGPSAPARAGPAAATVPVAELPDQAAEPPAAHEPAPGASDPELADRWHELVMGMAEAGEVGGLARELALQAQAVAVQGTPQNPVWRLATERESLRGAATIARLTEALRARLGPALVLDVQAGTATDTPARRLAAARERRQRDAEATIQSDPVVRALLDEFAGARLVPGSIKPL